MRWVLVAALAGTLCACAPTSAVRSSLIQNAADADGSVVTYAVGVTQLTLTATRSDAELPASCKSALEAYQEAVGGFVDDEAVVADTARQLRQIAQRIYRPASPSLRNWDDWEGSATDERTVTPAQLASAVDTALPLARRFEAVKSDADEAHAAALSRLRLVRRTCPERPVSITMAQTVRPSQEAIFGLRLHGGATSSDDLSVQTERGILTSVAMTADDQSAEIATGIGKNIGQILAPSPWGSLAGYRPARAAFELSFGSSSPSAPLFENCDAPDEVVPALAYYQRRTECLSANEFARLIIALTATHWSALPAAVDEPPPPATYDLANILLNEGQAEFGRYELLTACSPDGQRDSDEERDPNDRFSEGPVDGLVLALPLSCRYLVVEQNAVLGEGYFVGLTDRQLYVMPVDRQVFASNETSLTLTSGALTGVTLKRPSPVASIIGLPGNVLGGVVSGITAGLQGDENIRNAEAARLRAETALLAARAEREARNTTSAPAVTPPGTPPE
jgi:hypothetical protein